MNDVYLKKLKNEMEGEKLQYMSDAYLEKMKKELERLQNLFIIYE